MVGPEPAALRTPPPAKVTRLTDASEARNLPDVGLLLAERLDFIDRVVTLRVRAEIGDYFNCYYKGQTARYYHLRLRGDGSAYLDGYLPKNPASDGLWLRIQKQVPYPLTVRVVMRAATVSNVCSGQVEILEASDGWDFARGAVAEPGARARSLKNQRDIERPNNRPPVDELLAMRQRFVGKKVSLRVRGRLDRYYQCRYGDAERTHYALFLQGDGFKGLRAYLPREQGRDLARTLATDEGARLRVDVTIPEGRLDDLCPDQVEITGFQLGW